MLSRADLLRGRFGRHHRPQIRPPGAIDETGFLASCTRCEDCRNACPQQVIVAGNGGYPTLDTRQAGCTFCGACQRACTTAALGIAPEARLAWRPVFADSCLALNRVVCRSCSDSCDTAAISFALQTGGRSQPVLDGQSCTGCGHCVSACPSHALSMHSPSPDEESPA